MKTIVRTLSALLILVLVGIQLPAQEAKEILCTVCKQPNAEKNNYCTSCGSKLTAETKVKKDAPIVFRQPARLFSIPTSTVLPEMHAGITLGNAFGLEIGQSFLGTVGLGLGEIAEIELSTSGLLTGLAAGTASMKTAGLKVLLSSEDGALPSVGLTLQSSNDWSKESRNDRVLSAAAQDEYKEGLRGLDYESRITTLSLSFAKNVLEQTTLHGGIGFSDIRYRNVVSYFAFQPSIYSPEEVRKSQWQVFGGFVIGANPRTAIMAEVQTMPFFRYKVSDGRISLSRMYVGAAGIRFSLSSAWSLDSGVRYQSNFVGLADVQFRVALNGVFALR